MGPEERLQTLFWELLVDSIKVTVAGGLGGMAFYFMQTPGFFHSLGGIIATISSGMVLIALIRLLDGGERPI